MTWHLSIFDFVSRSNDKAETRISTCLLHPAHVQCDVTSWWLFLFHLEIRGQTGWRIWKSWFQVFFCIRVIRWQLSVSMVTVKILKKWLQSNILLPVYCPQSIMGCEVPVVFMLHYQHSFDILETQNVSITVFKLMLVISLYCIFKFPKWRWVFGNRRLYFDWFS